MAPSDESILNQWSKREDEIENQQEHEERQHDLDNERHPRRTLAHRFFLLLRVLAFASALLMLLGQGVGLVYYKAGPIQYVLRLYVCVLCLLVMCNEWEWFLTRDSKILQLWFTRGLFYSFVGVLGLEENDTASSKAAVPQMATTYIAVVAWLMVATGMLYSLLGLLCLQGWEQRLRRDYAQRRERAAARQ